MNYRYTPKISSIKRNCFFLLSCRIKGWNSKGKQWQMMERVDPISWCWHCYSRYFQPKTQSEATLFYLGIIILYNILVSVLSINSNLYLYLLLVSKGRRLWDAVNHGLRWCIDRRWSAQIWASHSFWVLLADNEPSMLLYFRNILLLHQTDSFLRILITDLSHSHKFSGV